jgi:ribosomal protein S27E
VRVPLIFREFFWVDLLERCPDCHGKLLVLNSPCIDVECPDCGWSMF